MAIEKRLIDINKVINEMQGCLDENQDQKESVAYRAFAGIIECLKLEPTVDAVEVVHGRWARCGGDLHSSGYAVYCSVCNKNHFVHYKYSLGGLSGCKELFERPKYCPSCGAIMEEGNDL